ncbi:MAG: hypothetical protein KQI81_13635 [Deltaproteobacteria bacterium]|nr:hypothetical protein [Deltaproteobacteria bacterium]
MRYLLIGLVVGLFAVTPRPLQAQDTAELPTFKVGDNWTYQRTNKFNRTRTGKFVVTVTSVSGSGFATSTKVIEGAAKDEVGEYTTEMNALKDNDRKFTPYVPYFSFPLAPGKAWEGSWKYSVWGKKNKMETFNATMKSRVEGWEIVTTPAGEFNALKIVFEATHANPHSGRGKETKGTRWYCPEVRRIVRNEVSDEGGNGKGEVTELVSFSPAN